MIIDLTITVKLIFCSIIPLSGTLELIFYYILSPRLDTYHVMHHWIGNKEIQIDNAKMQYGLFAMTIHL